MAEASCGPSNAFTPGSIRWHQPQSSCVNCQCVSITTTGFIRTRRWDTVRRENSSQAIQPRRACPVFEGQQQLPSIGTPALPRKRTPLGHLRANCRPLGCRRGANACQGSPPFCAVSNRSCLHRLKSTKAVNSSRSDIAAFAVLIPSVYER